MVEEESPCYKLLELHMKNWNRSFDIMVNMSIDNLVFMDNMHVNANANAFVLAHSEPEQALQNKLMLMLISLWGTGTLNSPLDNMKTAITHKHSEQNKSFTNNFLLILILLLDIIMRNWQSCSKQDTCALALVLAHVRVKLEQVFRQ